MHASRGFIRARAGSAAAMVVLVICSSCSAAESTPAAPVTTSARPAPSLSTVSVEPAATSQPTAPPELQASWQATISTGEDVTLMLSAYGYTVRRGEASGIGNIKVDGNRIVFSSPRCELGSGAYEWSIEDGALVFTPLDPRDPCVNRIIFLEDAIYTRTD